MEKQAENVFERFLQFVNKHPYHYWDIQSISRNHNLTFEMIEKYSNINWDWSQLTYNPNVTLEVLKNMKINHGNGKTMF